MVVTRRLSTLLFATCSMLLACNQDPPNVSDSTSDTAGDGDGDLTNDGETYYPLVDGATWTYRATNSSGQVLGTEVVDVTETTFADAPAWIFSDNPDDAGEWTESTIARLDTAAVRVHKEIVDGTGVTIIVDYDPGFVRVDDAWDSVGQFDERTYTRTETDGAGLNPMVEPRGHTFEVTAVDESVTVPAGTFSCTKFERIRTTGATAGERVVFWYARGVGKIREERPAEGRIEELVSVSIPGGASYP